MQEYKGYFIEIQEEQKLVGGPYENNEERQWIGTGKVEYYITTARNRRGEYKTINHFGLKSIKDAKEMIDFISDKPRMNGLQRRYKTLQKKKEELEQHLYAIECKFYNTGIKLHGKD